MKINFVIPLTLLLFFLAIVCSSVDSDQESSIIFTTLGRSSYAFDIYTLPIPNYLPSPNIAELKITDGISVNFNGHFPNCSSSAFLHAHTPKIPNLPPPLELIYVTERNGTSNIYYDAVYEHDSPSRLERSRSRVQVPLLDNRLSNARVSMKDRPSLAGDELIYVSTHQESGAPRESWAAVYSTHLPTGSTSRLTPKGVADFSPAVSPSGRWTAVASFGKRGWSGEVDELRTDIYVFSTKTGSDRVKVVEHGGWPAWVDDFTFYFHRRSDEDGWWSVYRARLPRLGPIRADSLIIERVTPPGLHVFTPATSPGNEDFIAVATRRPGSDYRHVELFDLVKGQFKEVTLPVSPHSHHFNPFIFPDSTRIGYHRCRGDSGNLGESQHLFLENLENPRPDISLFRIDGSYPSFSPAGDRIAFVSFPGLYVANRDGSNRREVFRGTAFSTAWDPVREGVVYTSTGPTFASEGTDVDVISINVDAENPTYKKLTVGGRNNAFPSPSPDGKWVVFRSGRSGHKNLYIMDAVEGESGHIRRLTDGPWTDTMCNWSPDGEWIVFSSDREDTGSGSYEMLMIRPNGTGLRKVFTSGSGGRANHPWFSPDMKSVVFTSDYAGVSAEPVSNPHHYQPYGDIFVARLDGSGIQRLTHNSYEDGTPSWGPRFLKPVDVARPSDGDACDFDDCHWLNVGSQGVRLKSVVSRRAQCGQRTFEQILVDQHLMYDKRHFTSHMRVQSKAIGYNFLSSRFEENMGEVDDSYRKPGTIPFKWESRPGVPKPYKTATSDHHCSPAKLTPPPSSLGSGRSFRSVTRLRPDRHRPEPPMVVSDECFFSPLFRRRWAKKNKKVAHKASPEYRQSGLSSSAVRKSFSLWESSTCSSSFSSFRSPQPVREPEWAGFGLF
ncbi:hypothetical protein V2J09_017137 [Rumex salicifolius]